MLVRIFNIQRAANDLMICCRAAVIQSLLIGEWKPTDGRKQKVAQALLNLLPLVGFSLCLQRRIESALVRILNLPT